MKNTLSNTYWDIYAAFYDKLCEFPTYRDMINEVYQSLNVNNEGIYLDVGCGTGALAKKITTEGCAKVYGIDSSSFMLKMAMRKNKSNKAIFLQGDISQKLPFDDEFFDGVACVHVLNYLENPFSVIWELNRILKKGGRLSLVCLKKLSFSYNIDSYKRFLQNKRFEAIESLIPLLMVGVLNAPMKIGYGVNFYDKDTLKRMLTKYNLIPETNKDVYANQSILIECKK